MEESIESFTLDLADFGEDDDDDDDDDEEDDEDDEGGGSLNVSFGADAPPLAEVAKEPAAAPSAVFVA